MKIKSFTDLKKGDIVSVEIPTGTGKRNNFFLFMEDPKHYHGDTFVVLALPINGYNDSKLLNYLFNVDNVKCL